MTTLRALGWIAAAVPAAGLAVFSLMFALAVLRPRSVGPLLRLILSVRYRLALVGLDHLPRSGPVLLAANHVTWIDGFLLVAACPRQARSLVNADYLRIPVVDRLARRLGVIPLPAAGPRAQRLAIEAARAALDRGELLLIFPEAQMTRNGLLGTFHRGLEVILEHRAEVAIAPVYLHNLWGSNFSFSGGRFLWKFPRGLRRDVVVSFGPRLPGNSTAFEVRGAVLDAGVDAVALSGVTPARLELDPRLPSLVDSALGTLAGSTDDFDRRDVVHHGQKQGSLGRALPGVALRVVDDAGLPLGPGLVGALQARTPRVPDWTDLHIRGVVDRDGFVFTAAESLGARE